MRHGTEKLTSLCRSCVNKGPTGYGAHRPSTVEDDDLSRKDTWAYFPAILDNTYMTKYALVGGEKNDETNKS
jgi:hypothetical protein